MPSRVTALPRRGSWSWRLTPLTSTARPFTRNSLTHHLHPAEPHIGRDDVDLGARPVEQRDHQVVPRRHLGAPRRHVGDVDLHHGPAAVEDEPGGERVGGVLEARRSGGGERAAVVHRQVDPSRPALRPVAVGAEPHHGPQPAGAGGRVVVGGGMHVGHVGGGRGVGEHAPVEAGVVPVVLVLQVRGVGPADDGEGQLEGHAGLDDAGQVDLVGEPGVLPHGDGAAIDVHVEDRLGPRHVDHQPPAGPRRRQRHGPAVDPRGVGVGDRRRPAWERHLDVGVLRPVVALHGPAARHLDGLPPVGGAHQDGGAEGVLGGPAVHIGAGVAAVLLRVVRRGVAVGVHHQARVGRDRLGGGGVGPWVSTTLSDTWWLPLPGKACTGLASVDVVPSSKSHDGSRLVPSSASFEVLVNVTSLVAGSDTVQVNPTDGSWCGTSRVDQKTARCAWLCHRGGASRAAAQLGSMARPPVE